MIYELTFLLNEETELPNLKKLVSDHNGKITKEENLGKKSLAYPIKKNHSANFYCWTFEMDNKQVTEFRKKLNFNDKLIRYLLLVS